MNPPRTEERVEQLEHQATAFLVRTSKELTPEYVRDVVQQHAAMPLISASDEECETVARRIEAKLGVTMSVGSVLTEDDYEPWLQDAQKEIDPYYWERYRQLLTQKIGSPDVITKMNQVTDKIVGLLENPAKEGSWDRRGLVMGNVQSGKTANYIGTICKAADAGYKVIIVIAGIHNNLRSQTQQRIDEGFVGYDSSQKLMSRKAEQFIGVGKYNNQRRPAVFTSTIKDFHRHIAETVKIPLYDLKIPAVFVIKKNNTTLENLTKWLQQSVRPGGRQLSEPMLLIDDEADNASINVMYGKDEVSKINGQIRRLLKLFEKRCYVGYTATPFANIFVDPDSDDDMYDDDLFPRNFIVSLDPPTNYFGARRIFLDEESSEIHLNEIHDNEDILPVKHKIDQEVTYLPGSLRSAIRAFVVARAIRLLRGHTRSHCSMLVNASRFTVVQSQLRDVIHAELDRIQRSVKIHAGLAPEQAVLDAEMSSLHRVWKDEYAQAESDWTKVQAMLHESAAPIRVVEVNSRSKDGLDYSAYKNGLNVIAVGGYSLSRGLTLEGLMISYFLRNSMMYDTLMQMGRWFGYRPGYEDLCRIWMPDYAIGWYEHISESIELLRDELREMEKANATPREFGLKVRSHPDTLIVTAKNKMGSGKLVEMNIGLGNRFVETTTLRRDDQALQRNLQLVDKLAENMRNEDLLPTGDNQVPGGWLIRKVPVNTIVEFIRGYQNHHQSVLSDPDPVVRYINERAADELAEWDLLLASVKRADGMKDHRFEVTVNCQTRTTGEGTDDNKIKANRQRIASRGIERTGLSQAQIDKAEREFREKKSGEHFKSFPDHIYRSVRNYPLLILHMIDFREKKTGERLHDEPVVAWSISFPHTEKDEKNVKYVVNTTWLQEHFTDEADDDIEEDDHES